MTPYGHWSGAELERRMEQTRTQISAYETIQIRLRDAHQLAAGETESGDLFEEIMRSAEDFDTGIDLAISNLRNDLEELEDEITRRESRYYDRME